MIEKPSKQSLRFTPETLQTIIQKNLTLYQYFDHLYPILKSSRNANEPLKQSNLTYHKDCLAASILKMVSENAHFDELTPILGSSPILSQQSYEYGEIEEALNSKEFIQKLHPYINSLLTTTNIGIVKETLKVHMLMETNIQKSKALHRIKSIINILTLYQLQKNETSITCDLEGLNRKFCKVGFIISKEQYEFYYNELWDDLPEVNMSFDYPGGPYVSQQKVKNLQIYDLIALAAQLQETQVLKTRLRQWMNSQEFYKYYSKTHAQRKKNFSQESSLSNMQTQSEQLIEENLAIVKLRIQHLNPMELLHEIDKRGYNISVHYKHLTQFRKGLLEFHDKETSKKKLFQMINSKSHKNINTNLTTFQSKQNSHVKGNKSNFSSSSSKQFSNAGQQRRENQHKLQQQAFNSKMLNGVFIRDQIAQQIALGKVNYSENCYQDFLNDESSFSNQNSQQKMSCFSIKTKANDDACKEDLRETVKTAKTSKLNTKSKLNQNQIKIVQNKNNKQKKIENKKTVKKMTTSINISMGTFSSTSTPSISPKKQKKNIKNGDYYSLMMAKVKGEAFFNLGAKILNK